MKMKFALALALLAPLLIFLAGCYGSSAPPPPPLSGPGYIAVHALWQDWQAVGLMAVFIAMLIAALAYMLGSAISSPMLMAWSKSEVMQGMGSALIMGGLIAGFSAINAIGYDIGNDAGLTGLTCNDAQAAAVPAMVEGRACHIAIAQRYLEIVYENLFEMNKYLMKTASLYLIIADFSISFETLTPPWLSITIVPFPGMNMLVEGISNMFDLLMKTMLLVKMQEMALEYVWRAVFPLLLVLGVITRSFFFTRRLGGLLIALAVAAYAVVPLLYVLSFNILDRTTAHSYVLIMEPEALKSEVYGNDATTPSGPGPIDDAKRADIAGRMASLNRRQGGFLNTIERAFDPGNSGNWYYGDEGLLERVSRLLLYATFIPFAVLMGTIAFVKAFSPLLGGDVEIAGITHLI